jgi:hypothetical protein
MNQNPPFDIQKVIFDKEYIRFNKQKKTAQEY